MDSHRSIADSENYGNFSVPLAFANPMVDLLLPGTQQIRWGKSRGLAPPALSVRFDEFVCGVRPIGVAISSTHRMLKYRYRKRLSIGDISIWEIRIYTYSFGLQCSSQGDPLLPTFRLASDWHCMSFRRSLACFIAPKRFCHRLAPFSILELPGRRSALRIPDAWLPAGALR